MVFDVFYDWVVANFVFFWLIIAILFLISEMGTPGFFFFLSFFFGALISAAATFFTGSFVAQSVIFLVGSVFSFLVLHFWIKRKMSKPKKHELTNIYALQGKRGKVLKEISSSEPGRVKIYSETWSARPEIDEVIKEGEYVIVVSVRGSHLIVKKLEVKKNVHSNQ